MANYQDSEVAALAGRCAHCRRRRSGSSHLREHCAVGVNHDDFVV